MVTQTINLSMIPGAVNPVIHVSQYDNDEDALIFNLYAGAAFDLPVGSAAVLNGTKPDGYGFTYNATSQSGNTVTFDVTQQMTAVAGEVKCELRISDGGNVVGTQNFTLMVEPAALDENTVVSDSDIPAIAAAADYAVEAAGYAADAANSAAEAAATVASKVDKSGDTMTGSLFLTDGNYFVANNAQTKGTNPSTDKYLNGMLLRDSADSNMGSFRAFYSADGTWGTNITAIGSINNNLGIGVKGSTAVIQMTHPSAWRDAMTVIPYNNTISLSYLNCSGFVSNTQQGLHFLIPYPMFKGTSVSVTKLGIVLRYPDLSSSAGIYPYARSGTGGGTYTALGSSIVWLWQSGAAARSNEISSLTATLIQNVGIDIYISFNYALAKTSGNTAAVENNLPASVQVSIDATIS